MAVSLEHRIPPPVVGALTAALMLGAAWALPWLAFPLPYRTLAAVLLAWAGVVMAIAGWVEFRRARTTINPLKPHEASALVTRGIYRWTRNPMYLGMATVLAGFGAWLANGAALAVISLFVAYLNRFQIAPEERALEARFGTGFTAYRERVRRWL